MSDAPERIWIDAWGGNWSPVSGGTQEIEYIRADRIEALTAKVKLMDDLDAINGEKIEALTKERDEAMQLLQTLSNMNGDLSRDMYKTKLLLAKAVEALDDLLEAITAEDRFGDRSLTITGPTANLKWLLETEEEARTTLAEIEGIDAS